jgi:hypothetical protein
MRAHSASNSEVIFYSYGIGSIYLLAILASTGNLGPGILAFSSVRFKFNKMFIAGIKRSNFMRSKLLFW